MALLKNARKVVGPANDFYLISDCGSDLRHQTVGTTDGHGEIHTQVGEALSQFRRAARGRMDHVQNAALRVDRRQHAIRSPSVGKFGTYRKTKHLDFFRGHSGSSQDEGALLVCDKEIIGCAPIPNCVDSNRIGDYNGYLARPGAFGVSFLNSPEYIRIDRKSASHHIRLKTLE